MLGLTLNHVSKRGPRRIYKFQSPEGKCTIILGFITSEIDNKSVMNIVLVNVIQNTSCAKHISQTRFQSEEIWSHNYSICCTRLTSNKTCVLNVLKLKHKILAIARDHFVLVPSQWEKMLHCSVICHLLGACTKWSLIVHLQCMCLWHRMANQRNCGYVMKKNFQAKLRDSYFHQICCRVYSFNSNLLIILKCAVMFSIQFVFPYWPSKPKPNLEAAVSLPTCLIFFLERLCLTEIYSC